MKPIHLLLALALFVCGAARPAPAAGNKSTGPVKPAPALANEKYGPHPRNLLDLWKAPSATPTPLVVYIHGGGFSAGSKETLSPSLLAGLLKAGISVMAINYRLSPEYRFPAHYKDAARSIQYARLHAKEWNIDPKRIGATGGSAGAGTSLWIGFHDDLAEPKSDEPVGRESTRLNCMAVMGAQSTYDPHQITAWVGAAAAQHPALKGFYGLPEAERDTPQAHKLYEDAAPIHWLTADDPPVYAFYGEARGPLPADAKPGQGIHHINFGLKLKERMDQLGIPCTIRHSDEGAHPTDEMIAFFVQHLRAVPAGKR